MKSLLKRPLGHGGSGTRGAPVLPDCPDLPAQPERGHPNTLSRTRSGRLMRIRRAVYMRPIEIRFGTRASSLKKAFGTEPTLWEEAFPRDGSDAANWLGWATQDTVKSVHQASGPDRYPTRSMR